MRKISSICLLTVSIGFIATVSTGAAIAYEPHCHDAYQRFYNKIHTPRKLNHKPSKATIQKWTAYNEEMLRKLDFSCAEVIKNESRLERIPEIDINMPALFNSGIDVDELSTMAVDSSPLVAMIPEKEYPTYANPSDDSWSPFSGGFYGNSGGWFSGGGVRRGVDIIPVGPPIVTPPKPVPEPATLTLSLIGALAWIVNRSRH